MLIGLDTLEAYLEFDHRSNQWSFSMSPRQPTTNTLTCILELAAIIIPCTSQHPNLRTDGLRSSLVGWWDVGASSVDMVNNLNSQAQTSNAAVGAFEGNDFVHLPPLTLGSAM